MNKCDLEETQPYGMKTMANWKETDWRVSEHCVNCAGELAETYQTNGVCPLCGYKDKTAHAVVKTFDRVYKVRYKTIRWWEFWKSPESYRVYKNIDPKEDINSPEYDPLSAT